MIFQLLRDKIIKIVPSGGYGRDTDYTIELQLTLADVKGFGEEKPAGDAAAAPGGDMGGGDMGASPPPAESPTSEIRFGSMPRVPTRWKYLWD